MFFDRFKKIKETIITQPVEGQLVPLSEVADPVFSQGVMGIGFAVRPINGKIFSPVDGVVESVFPTQHAVTLKSDAGIELLLHIGIDTVELGGKGIQTLVKAGQKITAKTQIAEVDLTVLAEAEKSSDIIVVFPNLDQELIEKFDLSGETPVVATL
ncbi:PTS glucose transporter subunit IIA [Enterococcus hulanensis]|uniref:PTS sugar transporter subunit IIA n=1 Tax=Enterococcus hulanensis TaxID=2559929 RepID=UPI001A8CCA38|nr:PTS glucose transporter subunit IIA [Enterococcus hulanensis]MBO0457717.1 PTS glucose transporter subunit IIA [Enterococcus hulanensis]